MKRLFSKTTLCKKQKNVNKEQTEPKQCVMVKSSKCIQMDKRLHERLWKDIASSIEFDNLSNKQYLAKQATINYEPGQGLKVKTNEMKLLRRLHIICTRN